MIPFVKAQADGNDFLIVAEEFAGDRRAERTRILCNRNTGIGADGVAWVRPADDGLAIELTNADGSYAEISGNGTRCVAAWIAIENSRNTIRIHTGAGERVCEVLSRGQSSARVRITMGVPQWQRMAVSAAGKEFHGIHVNIGNPHFVLLADAIPEDWEETGALLTGNAAFPSGANIEFVRVAVTGEIEFRIFERGVGPTRSSGTGSAASGVAAIVEGAPVCLIVRSQGGAQQVEWSGHGELLLTGEAHMVARGEAWVD